MRYQLMVFEIVGSTSASEFSKNDLRTFRLGPERPKSTSTDASKSAAPFKSAKCFFLNFQTFDIPKKKQKNNLF